MMAFLAGFVVGMVCGVLAVVAWAVLAVSADAEREVKRWGMDWHDDADETDAPTTRT